TTFRIPPRHVLLEADKWYQHLNFLSLRQQLRQQLRGTFAHFLEHTPQQPQRREFYFQVCTRFDVDPEELNTSRATYLRMQYETMPWMRRGFERAVAMLTGLPVSQTDSIAGEDPIKEYEVPEVARSATRIGSLLPGRQRLLKRRRAQRLRLKRRRCARAESVSHGAAVNDRPNSDSCDSDSDDDLDHTVVARDNLTLLHRLHNRERPAGRLREQELEDARHTLNQHGKRLRRGNDNDEADSRSKRRRCATGLYGKELSEYAKVEAELIDTTASFSRFRRAYHTTHQVHFMRRDVLHALLKLDSLEGEMRNEMLTRIESYLTELDPLVEENAETVAVVKDRIRADNKRARFMMDAMPHGLPRMRSDVSARLLETLTSGDAHLLNAELVQQMMHMAEELRTQQVRYTALSCLVLHSLCGMLF
ncbi:MAG: hypothetical protein MHM6MM_003481, partial [Cercozoa sp. M6MM]